MDKKEIVKHINFIKNWGDKRLPIDKRVELIGLLNEFLEDMHNDGTINEDIFKHTLTHAAFGNPKAQA